MRVEVVVVQHADRAGRAAHGLCDGVQVLAILDVDTVDAQRAADRFIAADIALPQLGKRGIGAATGLEQQVDERLAQC